MKKTTTAKAITKLCNQLERVLLNMERIEADLHNTLYSLDELAEEVASAGEPNK